jgi:hypothetical protein
MVLGISLPEFNPGNPPLGQIGIGMIADTSPNVKFMAISPITPGVLQFWPK